MSKLRAAAYHESGHLVVAHALGYRLLDGTVHRDGSGLARTRQEPDAVKSSIMIAFSRACLRTAICR